MKKLIIEKDKLIENIETIKAMTSSVIIAVLKGNGYGLGLSEYARLLSEHGIDFFAVSDLSEALALKDCGVQGKILLFTPPATALEAQEIVSNGIVATLSSVHSAKLLDDAGRNAGVEAEAHLKLDTGFGRFGFLPHELENRAETLKSLEFVKITGTYSHLSFSFGKKPGASLKQLERFLAAVQTLKQKGIDPGMLHIANSCAFLRFKDMHLDAVRIGSAFLGRLPLADGYGLKRIGYLTAQIVEVKDLPAGWNIGYANTCRLKRASRIGTIPVGFSDGFGVEKTKDTFRLRDILRYIFHDIKLLNRRIYVNVNGRKARVLGRINTHNMVIDLTETDAKAGDTVVLDVNPLLLDSGIEREYT